MFNNNNIATGSNNFIYTSTGGLSVVNIVHASSNNKIYYNDLNCQFLTTSNNYLYAVDSSTQSLTGTTSSIYKPYIFHDILLSNNWNYSTGASGTTMFTGTFTTTSIYEISYDFQVHSHVSPVNTFGSYIEINGTYATGSFRSLTSHNNDSEYIYSNNILYTFSPGSYGVRIMIGSTKTQTSIQPSTVMSGYYGATNSGKLIIKNIL